MTRGFVVERRIIDDLGTPPGRAGLHRSDRSTDEVPSCR